MVAGPVGLEETDAERSPTTAAASLGVKPKPNGDGRGVVERGLLSAGLEMGAEVGGPETGREPIGPTAPMGPVDDLETEPCREEGEPAAAGEDEEVPGCSGKPALMAELGEEVLLAREGDCRFEAASVEIPPAWFSPKGPLPRGEATWAEEVGVPALGVSTRVAVLSSASGPGGKKAGLSLPYRARCWRARRSRRLSSLRAAGLLDRSDLLADISARRPMGSRRE